MIVDSKFTLDTNLLIYALDRAAGEKRSLALDLIARGALSKGTLMLQTLNELSRAVLRKKLLTLSQAEMVVRSYARSFRIVPPVLDDTLAAFSLQRSHLLSHWDAVLLATARRAGCDVFLSEDLEDRKRYDGLLVVNPFRCSHQELEALLSASLH